VHEHTKTDNGIEGPIIECETVSIAGKKRQLDARLARAAIRDGEHFRRCINPGYPRTATRQGNGGAAGTGADIEHGPSCHWIEKSRDYLFLCARDQLSDGSAEPEIIK
jgi:hypothetical protein